MPNQKRTKIITLFLFSLHTFFGFSQNIVINEFVSSNKNSLIDEDGDSPDWIELYNASNAPVNLNGYYLSDDLTNPKKWIFPSISIESNNFLIVFASGKDKIENEIHTNFKIKSEGEHLILLNSNEDIIDSISPINLQEDESYGRYTDGTENLTYLSTATPSNTNTEPSLKNEILFSVSSGFHNLPLNLTLTSIDSVYYTLDGSPPSLSSNLFTNQISISKPEINKYSLIPTNHISYDPNIWPNNQLGFREPPGGEIEKAAILRVQSYKNGKPSSKIITKTYFDTNIDYTFPIFSIVTDSLNLFDIDTGIYLSGSNLNPSDLDWTGNYYMRGEDWERLANIEFFNKNGEFQFSENVGIRISGNKSRSCPQKSLRLYFRDEYGKSEIEYPFFPSRNYQDFKRLTLRSSFTFWWGRNSLFADDLIHKIVSDGGIDMEIQKSQPSLVFINGEYWGVHNIRERQDKYYLRSLYGIDKDSVNIIAGNTHVTEGSAQSYIDLIDFVESNDMQDSVNYAYVTSNIEIKNYIDYFIIELYFNNRDWPGNNMKMWKPKTPGSKWRWLFYDLDAAFSDHTRDPFKELESNQSSQANLFKELIKNDNFKDQFVERFYMHVKTAFEPEIIEGYLEEMKSTYSNEVEQHIGRWGIPTDYQNWVNNCNHLENYIQKRPCEMEKFLIDNLNLDTSSLDLICNSLSINSIDQSIFSLYPNPSTGQINIYTEHKIEDERPFRIIDSRGKIVQQGYICCGQKQLDCSFLNDGIYFLMLPFNKQYHYQKFLIKN